MIKEKFISSRACFIKLWVIFCFLVFASYAADYVDDKETKDSKLLLSDEIVYPFFSLGIGFNQFSSGLCSDLLVNIKRHDFFTQISGSKIYSKEPISRGYLDEKEKSREIIDSLCDSYLIILPKLMGCLICQYAHTFALSRRYAHFIKRKSQVKKLKKIVAKTDFNPKETLCYIEEEMSPFKGKFGRNFYRQCKMLLTSLIGQWE